MTQPLLIEHDDGVDRVTLNRPESLNALDPSLMKAQFIRADLVAMRISAASASANPPPAAAP